VPPAGDQVEDRGASEICLSDGKDAPIGHQFLGRITPQDDALTEVVPDSLRVPAIVRFQFRLLVDPDDGFLGESKLQELIAKIRGKAAFEYIIAAFSQLAGNWVKLLFAEAQHTPAIDGQRMAAARNEPVDDIIRGSAGPAEKGD